MHIPVLSKEVLEYLNPKQGQRFVDATIGGGGHTAAILQTNPNAEVLGIDLDQTALDKLREELFKSGLSQKVKLVQGNYKDIEKIISRAGWQNIDGIILDLGFSSLQLDDPSRGLSFMTEGPLDMRYDSESDLTADRVVNRYPQKTLARIISDFGEEKFAGKIASMIVKARSTEAIDTTSKLAEIIRSAIPKPIRYKANDNIRRTFQAIRIEVNHELENLMTALPKILASLAPHGRIVVISFHSLEDRIVKEFFAEEAKGCVCPPEFPTCVCDKSSTLRILTRKPITASMEEITNNARSKPAKLRAAVKN